MADVTPKLKTVIVPPTSQHTVTVIFIHGLGDSGYGWKDVAEMFSSKFPHVKWILPHAPAQKVTANMGANMPSWFDILSFEFGAGEDEEGMLRSAGWINELITVEINAGINPDHIVLGGFSQGGAMTLLTGLTGERKLAGLAVMSCWLPLSQKFKDMASPHANSIPIFWGHGKSDPLVKVGLAKTSVDFLVDQLGLRRCEGKEVNGISYKTYNGLVHSACPEELADLLDWLKKIIPPPK